LFRGIARKAEAAQLDDEVENRVTWPSCAHGDGLEETAETQPDEPEEGDNDEIDILISMTNEDEGVCNGSKANTEAVRDVTVVRRLSPPLFLVG
jgi:hypothetical protein